MENTKTIAKARQGLHGTIEIPGDKSISHRSVMFSALGSTPVHITNFLHAQDCLSTAACMKALGASVEFESETALTVCGHGLHGLKEASTIIDAGNSGTTLRLMMGILAPQPFLTTFTGDASLHKRPMGRVIKPLSAMGAKIYGRENNTKLPITIVPAESRLHGMVYESPVASAQVKSAILLAGMYADGPTTVVEPFTSRDHTERMLEAFGVETKKEGTAVTIEPVDSFRAPEAIEVPGDISSAAYWLVAGSVVPGSSLLLKNVGVNPTRTGILDVLK
ncbi:3-phosphoshikimate 1-carboxyvinyltransferase, partial [Mitsuokella multacida]